jgi:hypothetical protein
MGETPPNKRNEPDVKASSLRTGAFSAGYSESRSAAESAYCRAE